MSQQGQQGQKGQQPSVQDLPRLEPLHPERCGPALYVNAQGARVSDPWARLGVAAGASADELKAAWAEQTRRFPPEQHPEEALALREARDRLTLPERLYERAFGALRVPDAQAWSLPTPPVEAAQAAAPTRLDARSRLIGQSILYVLVEQALSEDA
jgi:hypothetical protein